ARPRSAAVRAGRAADVAARDPCTGRRDRGRRRARGRRNRAVRGLVGDRPADPRPSAPALPRCVVRPPRLAVPAAARLCRRRTDRRGGRTGPHALRRGCGRRRGNARTAVVAGRANADVLGFAPVPPVPVPPDAEEFLRRANPAIVATLRRDGSPHTVPTWYDWEDGRVLLNMDESRV